MLLHTFFTPGLAISTYLLADETTRKSAIIDPTRNISSYLNYAAKEKLLITDVLETHVHADFVSGSAELKKALGNSLTIHCSAMGGKEWIPAYADHFVTDKEEISLGSLRLQAWHTPGHTPEHLMWLVFDSRDLHTPLIAFTGDFIFVGSIGRPDLLGKEQQTQLIKQLYNTLFERIPLLPDSLELYPAHGAGSLCGKEIGKQSSSTLGHERQYNPWLKKVDFDKWSESLLKNMPTAPQYFKHMKKMNVAGISKVPKGYPVCNAKQAIELMPQSTVVDVRNPDAFSEEHLKGSINIPPSPSAVFWASLIFSGEEQVLLVVSAIADAPAAIETFRLIGIDTIGIVEANAWKDSSQRVLWQPLLESTPNINVETLSAKQQEMCILDVRTVAEWKVEHIPAARLVELSQLKDSLKLLPQDKPIAVICHSGNRSSLAASMLRQAGFSSVFSVKGGMQAWQKRNQ